MTDLIVSMRLMAEESVFDLSANSDLIDLRVFSKRSLKHGDGLQLSIDMTCCSEENGLKIHTAHKHINFHFIRVENKKSSCPE